MSGQVAVKVVEGVQVRQQGEMQTGLPNAVFVAMLSSLMIKEQQRAWFFTQMFVQPGPEDQSQCRRSRVHLLRTSL